MASIPLQLAFGSSEGRHGQDGAAKLVNMYAETIGEAGKVKTALYAIDGMSRFSTLTGGGIRCMLPVSDDEMFVVSGRLVYRVDSTGTGTVVGGLVSDGLATAARNRRTIPQIVFVSDGNVTYFENNAYTAFTDPDLPPPNSVCQVSGYFVFSCDDGRFFIAGPDDISVDGLDYGTANGSADRLRRCFARGSDLLLFGTDSIEAWQDVGQADFPFVRTTIIHNTGCLSARSVASVGETVAFVDHKGMVEALSGYAPQRISTHAIERLIADDTDPNNIKGFAWTERGHRFYGITGVSFTRVYDFTTQQWHERRSSGLTGWRCGSAEQFGTRRVFGHATSPYLFLSDDSLSTEDSDSIICTAQLPPTHAFPNDAIMAALHMDIIPGVGTVGGSSHNIDPQLMLTYSDDGGDTWASERMLPMGKAHQKLTKVSAYRLGKVPHTGRTVRLSCSADVVRAIMGVTADVATLR